MFEWDRIKGYFYILSGLDAKVILSSQNEQECVLVIAPKFSGLNQQTFVN